MPCPQGESKGEGENMSKVNLVAYVKSGYSVLQLVTAEEARAEKQIVETAKSLKRSLRVWSCTEGFVNPLEKNPQPDSMVDPMEALNAAKQDTEEGRIYVMRDLHAFFQSAPVVRILRDIAKDFKQCRKTLILLGPVGKVPAELERDITLIEYALPDIHDIEAIFDGLYEMNSKGIGEISADERDRICQAALGLTTTEAENAIAKSIVEKVADVNNSKSVSAYVMEAKAEAVSKTGILEYVPCHASLADVGGLEELKGFLKVRSTAFSKAAREFGVPMPKGIMLAGPPGTGKSLTAKVCASILGVPLIKFDIGKVFGGLVGDSERNMRTAIQTAEAVGNCVLFVDEMEKAMGNISSDQTHETTKRIAGSFMTWLAEKSSPVFVVGTVNRIQGLDAALIRKGRFDEIFYVGLPNPLERAEILRIHIGKKGRDVAKFNLEGCVEASNGFSGAELEQAVISGLYRAFHEKRELTAGDIQLAIEKTNPLSVSRRGELEEMIAWAKSNAIMASAEFAEAVPAGVKTAKSGSRNLELS